MATVTRKLFYIAIIIQITVFNLHIKTYGIQDIDMIIYEKPGFKYGDIKEYELSYGSITSDKVKNIIKEDNYNAIMDMKNKLKDFFKFPFKYFSNIFKNFFSGKMNKTVRFISSNLRNVMPSAKVNLSGHIHSDDNATTTEVTEATTVTEINITPTKFSPTWYLKPQHYFSF